MASRKVAVSVDTLDDDLDADLVVRLLAALRVPPDDQDLAALDHLLDAPFVNEADTADSIP